MLGFWPIPMCKLTEFGGSPAENSGGFQWPIGAMEITGPTRRVCHPWPMDVSKIYDWDPQLDGGSKQGKLQPLGHFLSRFWTKKSLGPDPPRIFAITLCWALDDASELVAADWFQPFGGHIIQSPVVVLVVPFPMARLELAGGIVSTPGLWTISPFYRSF